MEMNPSQVVNGAPFSKKEVLTQGAALLEVSEAEKTSCKNWRFGPARNYRERVLESTCNSWRYRARCKCNKSEMFADETGNVPG